MGEQQPPREHQPARQPTYLPALTSALLALLLVWLLVWFFFQRPTEKEELQVASFARALEEIEDRYVGEVERDALYRAAMRSMVGGLDDKYSSYLTPDQMRRVGEETEGEFGGIGILISPATGQVLVEDVLPEGPAAEAGMEPGDVITHVDGEDVTDLPLQRVVSLIRGEVGSEVEITVLRPSSGESLTFALERDRIRAPSVRSEVRPDGIGVLRVTTFDERSADEVEEALQQFQEQGVEGLILDLRTNSGGLVEQAVRVCDMFLRDGMILALQGRKVEDEPPLEASSRVEVAPELPVVVLVDRWTASAAEIVAGTLQANGRATVVGTGTVGKGAVTSVLHLPDESGLLLTVARYELAGGLVIEGNGIEPDVVVGPLPEPPEDMEGEEAILWLRERRDEARAEQMGEAVRILQEELGER
jgi:carboxyl-terminal processing protease